MRIVRYEDTPNPDALKCVADGRLTSSPASFRSASSAAGHPLGEALFAVEGVTNVLILDDWVTVGRAKGVRWSVIKRGVEAALAKHAGEG